MKRLLLVLVLLMPAALRADPADNPETDGHMTGKIPAYRVANAKAPAVTEASLVENELFWPYQTALAKQWQSLARGSLGVLIRVANARDARIDFGRDGLHDVPISATDLVERANAIRLGQAEKLAPNFLLAIGPRLLDSRSPVVRAFEFKEAASHRAFLCVFADPWRKEFLEISAALGRLRDRPDVLTILFPQSHRPDSQVSGQLRAMQWTLPFVYAAARGAPADRRRPRPLRGPLQRRRRREAQRRTPIVRRSGRVSDGRVRPGARSMEIRVTGFRARVTALYWRHRTVSLPGTVLVAPPDVSRNP